MAARSRPVEVEDLLAHGEWLRRLACGLVGEDLADDVVQEAWIATLCRPPGQVESARAWLRTVAVNVTRSRFRSDGRRQAREAQVGRSSLEVGPESPADVLEREELRRFLADEIANLRQPYRQAVLLRYVEDLSAAEIARRLGVPAGTVRRRIKVGLDHLRASVDRRKGARQDWRRLLVPLAATSHQAPGADWPLLPPGGRWRGRGRAAGPAAPRPPEPLGPPLALTSVAAVVAIGIIVATAIVVRRERAGAHAPARAAERSAPRSPSPPAPSFSPAQPSVAGAGAEPGPAAAALVGTVLSDQAAPVDGATVTLSDLATRRPVGSVRTGRDGRFLFADVRAGRYGVTAFADSGWASRSPLILEAAARAHVDLVLQRGTVALEGQVRDRTGGGAIGGANVAVWEDRARWHLERVYETRADDRGHYRLLVPPGRYKLRADAPGYARAFAWPHLSGRRVIDIGLEPAARVLGRVIEDSSGRPVAQVVVSWSSAGGRVDSTTSDAAGSFSMGVEPGPHLVWARQGARFGSVQLAAVRAAETVEVVLPLARTGAMRGRIFSDPAQPVAQVTVVARPASSTSSDHRDMSASTVSDASGHYELLGLPPSALEVSTSGPGLASTSILVNAAADGSDRRIDIQVGPEAAIAGRLRLPGGAPAAGAEVIARLVGRDGHHGGRPPPDGQSHLHAIADRDGRFVLDGLPSGELWLTAEAQGMVATLGPQRLASGERAELTITLRPGAWVAGTVLDAQGSAAPSVRVEAISDGTSEALGFYSAGISDARGQFVLGPFDEGPVSLRLGWTAVLHAARAEPGWLQPQRLDLKSGERRQGPSFVVPPARP